MKGILGKVLVCTAILLGLAWVAAADSPHMKNQAATWKWVYRRDKNDPHKVTKSVATVVSLEDATGTGKIPQVKGSVTLWMEVDETNPKKLTYKTKRTYGLTAVPVTNGGENNYKHEYCKWTDVPDDSGKNKLNIHVSMFKPKNHGMSDVHRRLVIRFFDPAKAAFDNCCDDDPDDDVLEEENNPPDPPDAGP